MILDKNLEIFKENRLIEKLLEYFNYEKTEKNEHLSKEMGELFNFNMENEFGEGKNILTRYKITSIKDEEKEIYVNIAKSNYKNPKNNGLFEENVFNFTLINEASNLIYDIKFHTGQRAQEISYEKYFDILTDYDRVLNPQYYQEYKGDIDLHNEQDHEENNVIDLNSEQKYKSIYKNNMLHVLSVLNEQLEEDKKIIFSNTETVFNKENISELMEVLNINYFSPDTLAETVDGINKETYFYLWNNLVKFNEMLDDSKLNITKNKDELTVSDFWEFIPESHQKNIIESLSEMKEIKLKNGILLSSIIPKDMFGEKEEDKKIYMVRSKDNSENSITKIFKDKKSSEDYFKIYSNDKRNERLPF